MITLRDKASGYTMTGRFVAKTEDHYILEINNVTQMFKIDDWEEVRDAG